VMRRMVLAALTALLAWGGAARAENYPSRPITVIVPFAAGGPSGRHDAYPWRADEDDARPGHPDRERQRARAVRSALGARCARRLTATR